MKRNYLLLGFALLSMTVAVIAQDPPAKTTPKKAAASKSSGSAAKGKELFEQKCSICHFADSSARKIGPGLKGISKRGTFTVNNNKVTTQNSDDLDRERRLVDASVQRCSRCPADQGRHRLCENAIAIAFDEAVNRSAVNFAGGICRVRRGIFSGRNKSRRWPKRSSHRRQT